MTAVQTRERRRFRRFRYSCDATLYTDEATWFCEVVDLSMKGLLVTRPGLWNGEPGDLCHVEMRLAGMISISMDLVVSRVEENYVAGWWRRIDTDSFAQLRRLAELNLGDARLVERELAGLRPETR